jgi:hypothetical protein
MLKRTNTFNFWDKNNYCININNVDQMVTFTDWIQSAPKKTTVINLKSKSVFFRLLRANVQNNFLYESENHLRRSK